MNAVCFGYKNPINGASENNSPFLFRHIKHINEICGLFIGVQFVNVEPGNYIRQWGGLKDLNLYV